MVNNLYKLERNIQNRMAKNHDLLYDVPFYRKYKEDAIKIILHHASYFDNPSLLDVGCGTGTMLKLLQEQGLQNLRGADISENMLKIAANKNPNIPFRAALSEKLPYKDNIFDLVYLSGILHHLPSTDTTLKEIYRILKPGGIMLIFEPIVEWSLHKKFWNTFFKACFTPLILFLKGKNRTKIQQQPKATTTPVHRHISQKELMTTLKQHWNVLFSETKYVISPLFEGKTFNTPIDKLIARLITAVDLFLARIFTGICVIVVAQKVE